MILPGNRETGARGRDHIWNRFRAHTWSVCTFVGTRSTRPVAGPKLKGTTMTLEELQQQGVAAKKRLEHLRGFL